MCTSVKSSFPEKNKINLDHFQIVYFLVYYIGSSAKECSNEFASSELSSSGSSCCLGMAKSCISCTHVHSDCSSVVTFRLNTFQPCGCTYSNVYCLNNIDR